MISVVRRSFLMCSYVFIFFCKQKTAYEMRISDWSSDVCSSDLVRARTGRDLVHARDRGVRDDRADGAGDERDRVRHALHDPRGRMVHRVQHVRARAAQAPGCRALLVDVPQLRSARAALGAVFLRLSLRSEEHTSELQSLMR